MRLTEKDGSYREYIIGSGLQTCEGVKEWNNALTQKLGQLENIEEELGIDLITLFKAIKNGVWVKTKNGISQHFTISVRKWLQTNTYCLYYRPYTHVWFKNYGKTWALTKEELEND